MNINSAIVTQSITHTTSHETYGNTELAYVRNANFTVYLSELLLEPNESWVLMVKREALRFKREAQAAHDKADAKNWVSWSDVMRGAKTSYFQD